VILCASSLLGVIHTALFGLLLLAVLVSRKLILETIRSPRLWIVVGITAAAMAVLGCYYAWTLSLGARASDAPRTSLPSLAFAVSEILGFGGFGPGRPELRESGLAALRPYAGFLAISAIPYLLAAGFWSASRRTTNRSDRILAAVWMVFVLGAFIVIAGVGWFSRFRVIGRHFMPLAPFVFIVLGLIYSGMWEKRWLLWRAVTVISLLVSLAGSLNQRFSPRFLKDDCRSASRVAAAAQSAGKIVWWVADHSDAAYYGLASYGNRDQPRETQAPGEVGPRGGDVRKRKGNFDPISPSFVLVTDDEPAALAALPPPAIVIISKPDIYDHEDRIRQWALGMGLAAREKLPAFWIFGAPPRQY